MMIELMMYGVIATLAAAGAVFLYMERREARDKTKGVPK